jgi:fused signal recognition particle receptor
MIATVILLLFVLGTAVLFLLAARKLRRSRLQANDLGERREEARAEALEEPEPEAAPAPRPAAPRPAEPEARVIPFPARIPPEAPVAEPKPAPPAVEPAKREPPALKPLPRPAPAPPARRPEPPHIVAEPVAKPAPAPSESPRVLALRAERTRLRAGLAQTRGGFVARLAGLLRGRREIPPDLLARLEEILFSADIGVKTSQKLLELVRGKLSSKELGDAHAVMAFLRQEAARILSAPSAAPAADAHPRVVLVIGVNGTGKTTTIGKLAARLGQEGKKAFLVAGDTFRAAAVDQLEIWARRTGAGFHGGKEGADPSSVIFDGIRRAQAENADEVLCDTAGRLHTKTNLMEELVKVRRVAAKALPGAPHETLLVLDATTGQNAIAQAETFKAAMEVTGLCLTKLDGTAKGGVVLGVCGELGLPVRYLGIGERVEDLRDFFAEAFAEALLGDLDDEAAAADGPEGLKANK